jgi:hypothetical protein
MDAGSGQIVAASLTAKEVDDGAEVGLLLDQVTGVVASFIGDGGYDQDRVYASVAERHPEAAVVVPPRATAVPSETAETAPCKSGSVAAIGRRGCRGGDPARPLSPGACSGDGDPPQLLPSG